MHKFTYIVSLIHAVAETPTSRTQQTGGIYENSCSQSHLLSMGSTASQAGDNKI